MSFTERTHLSRQGIKKIKFDNNLNWQKRAMALIKLKAVFRNQENLRISMNMSSGRFQHNYILTGKC